MDATNKPTEVVDAIAATAFSSIHGRTFALLALSPEDPPALSNRVRSRERGSNVASSTRIVSLLVGIIMAGCQGNARHPVAGALPADGSSSLIADTLPPSALSPPAATTWTKTRRAILDARPGAVVGALEGSGPDVLGSVVDVEMDANGNIYILDMVNSTVTVFDAAGGFVHRMGGDGDGPLELRAPLSLAVLEDGRLAVSQLGGSLKTFAWMDGSLAFVDDALLGVFPRTMCTTGGRFFANAPLSSADTLVFEVGLRGKSPVRSFGSGYSHGPDLVNSSLNEGFVACRDTPDRIVFGFSYLPLLVSYSTGGAALWSTMVEDYAQTWFVEEKSSIGTLSVGPAIEYPRERLAGLHTMSSQQYVAVYRRTASENRGDVEWRTYLLDSSTGWGALIGSMEQPILAIDGTRYVTYISDSLYPRLQIWHMDPDS